MSNFNADYGNPEIAARKLVELTASVEALQDGRIPIEKINAPFLFDHDGKGSEFGAGLDYAVRHGWLELERGAYVRLTAAGHKLAAESSRLPKA